MDAQAGTVAVVAAALVVWGLLARRLERLSLTAPIFFVAAGLLLAHGPVAVVDVHLDNTAIRALAELTLALVLFSGAAGVDVHRLRRDAGLPARLLGIGLPLTIGLGFLLARLALPDLGVAEAALLAAAVAPTDAALGESITTDPGVPRRLRRTLNVESGLNDGIATPFVMLFLGLAVQEEPGSHSTHTQGAVAQLLLGALVGVLLGAAVGAALDRARGRGWTGRAAEGLVVLGLAVACYATALVLGGNGFIAAFVGGLAFGAVVSADGRKEAVEFDTETGDLLSALVWFGFGAAVLPLLEAITWEVVVFALLALTVVRMLPVGLALLGAGQSERTVLFLGWFGPRGLATVVFGLLAVEALPSPGRETLGAAVALTVLVSVLAHGLTARWGIGWLSRG